MKSNKYAQKPSQGYQVMSSGWFEQQSLWPSIRLHFDAVGFIAGKSQSVGGKIKGGSGCKICQMLLLACRTTVHHPLGCIVHWKHGSHSPRQAYYRKLHQSTPKDSWQLLLQAICLALYCRKEARPEKKRKMNRTKDASENGWDDRMNKPAWTSWTVEKNGKKLQMKPNHAEPLPQAIVRHLEKPSWFETKKDQGARSWYALRLHQSQLKRKTAKIAKLRWSVWNKSPIPQFSKNLMWNIMKHSSQKGKHRQYLSCGCRS